MYSVNLPITYNGEVVGEARVGVSAESGLILDGKITDDDFLDRIRGGGVPGMSMATSQLSPVCDEPSCFIHNGSYVPQGNYNKDFYASTAEKLPVDSFHKTLDAALAANKATSKENN